MEGVNQTYSLEDLKQKAIHGAISITFSRVLLLAISFGVINIFLPRYLSPSIIGTFNLATSIVSFFSFFSDVGLAASIIQKREVTQEDLTTTFTIQEILVAIISIMLFILAPFLAGYYHLDVGGSALIRALAISFFLISFKVIPSVLLERNLRFRQLVVAEICETLVRNGALLLLVFLNYGLYAYAFSEVASAIVGVVVLYNLSPWRVNVSYSKSAAKQLLQFGVPFQLNSLLALLKDQLVPLVVAHMITTAEIGFVTLAQSWAFIPLQVMNIVIRVTFPAYARLQDNREVLGRAVERSLYVMGLVLYPALAGLLVMVTNLVQIIGPGKWHAVVPLVYLFSFATFWASISTTYTNVFTAVGQIKMTLRLMIMWTALEWALTPVLVWQLGYIGVAISSAIISFSSVVTIIYMRQITQVRLLESIGKPILCSAIMALILYPVAHMALQNKLAVIPLTMFGAAVYAALLFAIDRDRMLRQVKEILHAIR